MNGPAKVGIVIGGYAGAVLIAVAVVAVQVALTSGPSGQASSGMFAFGDSVLFLAVLGIAAIPATCAALLFLRPHLLFWRILSVAALVTAATAVAAVIALAAQDVARDSVLHSFDFLAFLRIPLAPILAIAFCLAGLFAPNRSARVSLFVATVVEGSVMGIVALKLLLS